MDKIAVIIIIIIIIIYDDVPSFLSQTNVILLYQFDFQFSGRVFCPCTQ